MKLITTSKGVAYWTVINNGGKENKLTPGEFNYHANILLPIGEQTESIIQVIKEEFTENSKFDFDNSWKPYSYTNENAEKVENINDATHILFKFKQPVKTKNGNDSEIIIKDSKNNRVPNFTDLVGNGSIIKVSGVFLYKSKGTPGVSAYLNGIQILKLVVYNNVDFEVEEGEDYYTLANENFVQE